MVPHHDSYGHGDHYRNIHQYDNVDANRYAKPDCELYANVESDFDTNKHAKQNSQLYADLDKDIHHNAYADVDLNSNSQWDYNDNSVGNIYGDTNAQPYTDKYTDVDFDSNVNVDGN